MGSSWLFIENPQQETHQAELLTVKNSNKTANEYNKEGNDLPTHSFVRCKHNLRDSP